MKVVICRKDVELSGDPAIDRQRYRRGQVIDCLPDAAEPGAAVDANPFMQVIEVADLSAATADSLCQTEYQAWRAALDDAYFANPADPRRALDDPTLFARRLRRLDIDAAGLRVDLKDALAPGADHRARPAATAAELAAITGHDVLATQVSS